MNIKVNLFHRAALFGLFLLLFAAACAPVTQPPPVNSTPNQPVEASSPTSTAQPKSPVENRITAQYPQNDPFIFLSADPALYDSIQVSPVDAVPVLPNAMFASAHPSFVQFRLAKSSGAIPLQLPFPLEGPQVTIYQTRDFVGYAVEGNQGFPSKLQGLQALLSQKFDPSRCAVTPLSYEQELPFLPVVNSKQVFCAQPLVISFQGGKGIRYLTYYSQGMDPAIDPRVFYTFQGLTDDQQYYVAAYLPVRTGVFPAEAPAPGADINLQTFAIRLKEQVKQVNSQPAEQFNPALSQLDQLISTVKIKSDQ